VKSGHASYEAAAGSVRVTFGLNNWLLVQLPNGQSDQRQVTSEPDLVLVLQDLGLSEGEAREAAAAAWRERPSEAGLSSASSYESVIRATGLSTAWVFVILAIFVLLALYAFTHMGRS
jgi:hypothetical protein